VWFLAFVRYQQNRRRKVFNRKALRLCNGAWHPKIWQKIHWFTVFHSSICGAWKFFWWGLSPQNPVWRQNRLPRDIYFKTVLPNHTIIHQNKCNTFSKLFFLKWLFLWLQMLVYRWIKATCTKLDCLRIGSDPLAVQTYNLSSKLATHTHQLLSPLQECHFPTPLCHAEKQQLYWNWAMFPLQSSSLQPPKFDVDIPT